jgi:hypothetical protein
VKGLIYPLLAIVAVAILVIITATVIVAINDARKAHAIHHARWEPYVDITGDGKASIGVRLIARWGHQTQTLRRDSKTEEIDVENFMERIEAYARAESRAESYNALKTNGEGE